MMVRRPTVNVSGGMTSLFVRSLIFSTNAVHLLWSDIQPQANSFKESNLYSRTINSLPQRAQSLTLIVITRRRRKRWGQRIKIRNKN